MQDALLLLLLSGVRLLLLLLLPGCKQCKQACVERQQHVSQGHRHSRETPAAVHHSTAHKGSDTITSIALEILHCCHGAAGTQQILHAGVRRELVP
jgi:hypothetical protein